MTELWQLDAVDLARLIRTGRTSATEATKSVLARIDAINPTVNAIVRRLDDEALAAAKDALETALDFYFENKRAVPAPSKPKRGQKLVELPASLSAKILLLNEMITQDVRPAELARRLNTTPQEVNRLTDVRHTTRIDGIAAALQALGKHLDMRVV